MSLPEIQLAGVPGLPEVTPGDDLAALVTAALQASELRPRAGDVLVVTQKVVSKAEGRLVPLEPVVPSERARQWAAAWHKDARVVEIILQQSKRIVRMERGVLIAETRHGFICANAGVDASNVPAGTVSLLPEDPDGAAARLRAAWERQFGVRLGVVISDTFGRPWREGVVNVALGVAGLAPLLDYRGQPDAQGRTLQVTVVAVADELASAAELVMGKARGIPVVLVRGLGGPATEGSGRELLRPPENDLFR